MQQPVAAENDDIAINEVALQRAEQQRAAQSLLKNFLPGALAEGEGEDTDGYSPQEELGVENYEEGFGIGYVPSPANGQATSESRERSAATELLRKQMLGKPTLQKYGVSATGKVQARNGRRALAQPGKSRLKKARNEEPSDDEEDGRSRLGKKGRPLPAALSEHTDSNPKGEDNNEHVVSETQTPKISKRGSSYLDQVLAQRAAKKQKKKER